MKSINRWFFKWIGFILFSVSSLSAQTTEEIIKTDFVPQFKTGERLVYQLVETKFRQNVNGHFTFLMYDTSYMVFKVKEVSDTLVLIDFNYSDYFKNGIFSNDEMNKFNFLKTETYQVALTPKGEFVELVNWEFFAQVLIDNIKKEYQANLLDSNTLKYYYINYHNQEIVEETVIPRVIEFLEFFAQSYSTDKTYSIAKEIVNPFGGEPIQKSVPFRLTQKPTFKNSMFFTGAVNTNFEDNETLQEEYYYYLNRKSPNASERTILPYIYIADTYQMQWGIVSKRILNFITTHTVYLDNDKQGLDRSMTFYSN